MSCQIVLATRFQVSLQDTFPTNAGIVDVVTADLGRSLPSIRFQISIKCSIRWWQASLVSLQMVLATRSQVLVSKSRCIVVFCYFLNCSGQIVFKYTLPSMSSSALSVFGKHCGFFCLRVLATRLQGWPTITRQGLCQMVGGGFVGIAPDRLGSSFPKKSLPNVRHAPVGLGQALLVSLQIGSKNVSKSSCSQALLVSYVLGHSWPRIRFQICRQ